MDVQEERYRKVINEYRLPFSNLISEYPIAAREAAESSRHRNLRYILNKAVLSSNYPYHNPIYQDTLEEIKANLTDQDAETKALALRLMRVLPFLYRVRLIENCENVRPAPHRRSRVRCFGPRRRERRPENCSNWQEAGR